MDHGDEAQDGYRRTSAILDGPATWTPAPVHAAAKVMLQPGMELIPRQLTTGLRFFTIAFYGALTNRVL